MKTCAWRFGRGEPQVRGWRPIFSGPLSIAFGVLDCGPGWSRRYRGFRMLWKGNRFCTVRLDSGVAGLQDGPALLDAPLRADVRAVLTHQWSRLRRRGGVE